MTKNYIFGLLLISLLFISSCNLGSQVTPVCNKPYILVGTECCLDQNDNSICDKDETIKEEISQNNTAQKEDIKTSFTDVINDAIKKVVKIEIKLPYGTSYEASGFFVDSNGYLVTNYHVIEDFSMDDIGKYLVIHTYSGDSYDDVEIAGYNYDYDLALLKINNSKSFDVLNFGDSNALQVGSKVYALGSPLGLNFSVSSGIISAKKRAGYYNENVNNYLQTDVSMNFGNSGGPLVNEGGEVVGLNTFGYNKLFTEGLNFALESNKMKELVENMIYTSRYIRLNNGFYQKDFNKKVNAVFVGEFDIKSPNKYQMEDYKTGEKHNTYSILFNDFKVNLNNQDEINHSVCFDLKIIYGGIQNLSKRLETNFNLKPNQQLTEPIPASYSSYTDGRDHYFETKVVECNTNEVYGEAVMRKYYTTIEDDKDREILVL